MQVTHESPGKTVATPGGGDEQPAEIQLRHFRAFKDAGVTMYTMEFSCGQKYWTTVRRYSEFRQCHVQLLEVFSRTVLPPFPPKEPLLNKMFKKQEELPTSEWNEDRKVLLYHYLSDLLEQPWFIQHRSLQKFIGVAPEDVPFSCASNFNSPLSPLSPLSPAAADDAADADDEEPVTVLHLNEFLQGFDYEQYEAARRELEEGKRAKTAGDAAVAASHIETACESSQAPDEASRSDNSPRSEGTKPVVRRKYGSQLRHSGALTNVISYQGKAAAAYARKIEEAQRAQLEKAPVQLKKDNDGSVMSIPIKFAVVGQREEAHNGDRSFCALESARKDRQAQQQVEDERQIAQWIHAVTGDPGTENVGAGEGTLQSALRSGEALCDLINAIWPGKVVGIRRGQTGSSSNSPRSSRKRMANIAHFLWACTELGVDKANLPVPSDLAEGKSSRNLVRCIFAVGALAAGAPEFDGPRLGDPNGRPGHSRGPSRGASPPPAGGSSKA